MSWSSHYISVHKDHALDAASKDSAGYAPSAVQEAVKNIIGIMPLPRGQFLSVESSGHIEPEHGGAVHIVIKTVPEGS